MTTFPKKIVEKLQVVPGGVTNLVKKGESNFRPDVPPPQPPDNEYGDGFVFSTHNNHPTEGELPIMLMMVILDNSWKLVDTDTGILVADGLGNRVDGVEIQQSDEGGGVPDTPNAAEVMVVLSQTGSSDKKYRLTGNIMLMAMTDFSQMSPPQPEPVAMSVSEGSVGQVIIHQWLAGVVQYVFSLADINLQVPRHLSPDIVSTQHMFSFSNLFNQDISTWNTSRVMNMATMFMNATSFNQDISGWDVSNVTNMDSMFESASQFNQDLSPWCVRKIPAMPNGFDNQASRWVKSRPSWGTCPAKEEEPPYVPPVEEEVDDDTVIKAFDYALIRYRWTPTGGEDLDTRTYLSKPNRGGRRVGWSRLKNDNSYLIWNEDNTGAGVESVLIDIDKIHVDYPGEQIVELKMDGFWYSQVKSGKLDIEFATFKGGKMVASGYDWINEGGLAIQILKLGVDTLVRQSSDIDGENLATLSYDTLLKKGTLVARDGPSIGDGGTVEPEVPVTPPEESGNGPGGIVDPTNPVYPDSEQGFTFSVEIRDNDGGSVPFDIRLVKVAPGWKVYSGNTLILSADKIHPQVSANVSMGDVTLTFNIPRKDIKTYTIIADAPSLAFEVTQTSFSGQDIVINRFSNTILNYQFSVTDATLRVPTVLPSYITSTSNMFLGANQFNQDISMWDTSNVTNMSGMFDNAETFNQDISGWDVSNVTNMMFMFRYAHKFNQPIGSWNVKNVTNMKSMFESAPAFNQDLSQWCVRKIATKPDRFDYSAHALYTSHLPVWGTCPRGEDGLTFYYTRFVTDNPNSEDGSELGITIDLKKTGGLWQAIDTLTGELLANQDEGKVDGVIVGRYGQYNESTTVRFNRTGVSTKQHISLGIVYSSDSIRIRGASVEEGVDYPPGRVFEITEFSPKIWNYQLFMRENVVKVPSVLPTTLKNCEWLFGECYNIVTDLSGWDTSHVYNTAAMFVNCKSFNQDISKWDVSNVAYMRDMFSGCTNFNQDLSPWSVVEQPSKPSGFDSNCFNWVKPKPIWGTSGVPGGPSYDDTGAFKFIVNGAPEVSEVAIEMYDPNPDWVLLRDGVLVGGGLQGNGSSITFANTDKSSSEYALIGSDFVTVLNEGGWSAEVDSIEVTQFPSKTVAVRFGLGGIPFTVPTTLPKNITTLGSMFSGCTKFNQDISMWDTSHVTEMYEVFKDCALFNQPLNTWDVSKSPELRGMFQGASVFNQPLDKWNVGAVTNVSEMFRYASKFNQDISSWNVSNVTNMSSMFSYASAFNQDLSKWCVTNLPQKPSSFDERASAWTKPKPVWGTCPDINGPVTDPNLIDVSGLGKPYLFNTSNVTDPSKEMVLDIQIYQYTSWQLVDLDSNKVIANSRGYFAPDIKDNQSQSDSADMQLARNKAGISNYALYAGGSGVSFNNSYRGSDTVAKFNLTQWGTGTTNAAFMLGGTVTTVPNELSPSITSTSSMFSYNNLFNQDISEWNVSKVVSMDYMFSQATSFNQDLSGWDVSLIPVEPSNFALLANAWTLPKPKWGTTGGSNPPSGLAPFSFTTSNRMASAPLPIALRVVSSGQAWSLIDAETKVVIHEVVEGNTPGEEEVLYLDELGSGAEHRYILEGAASEVNLSIDDEGDSDGFVKVESFSGDINQYKYDVKNADITVPLLLPKNVTNTDNMFAGCYNFNTDITAWDTSAITSMEGMFMGCTSFNQDIGGWDVSNVTNMANMFEGCVTFNGDISSWETHALENMYAMFYDCEVFNQNLNDWDVSNVTDMGMLFSNCRVFNQPLDNWDTSNCTTFSSCFSGATIFNQNINNWDVSKANDLNYMFSNALAFNQPLSNWVIPELYSLEATFMEAASFNQDISSWNVSLVHDMSYMFQGAASFNKPLNDWDTSSFSYANGMFDGAHNFNQPLDKWKTSSLSRMSTMFSEATSFNQDLSSWCMSNVDMSPHNFSSGCLDWAESKPIWGTCDDEPARTFDFTFTAGDSVAGGAKIRILIRNLQGGWELYRNDVLISSRTVTDARVEATPSNYSGLAILIEPVVNSSDKYKLKLTGDALELGYTGNDGNKHSLAVTQFSNGIANHEFSLYKVALTVPETLPTYVKSLVAMFKGSDNFNQNINAWDVAHIEEFTECFKDCTTFNQPLDTWEMGRSYSVESMFENCTAFNQDISSWDVTGQSRFLKMFSGCSNFNQSLDAWDVSNVWSFESMFNRCSSLNQDFTNWKINTDTGVNFYGMFEECTAFNGDITTWDTSRVGRTERMFTGCSSFNRDISGWDTANFTNMSYMFENAVSFDQDLSSWNVVKFPTMPYQFAGNTPSWTKPKPIWGTDGQVVLPPGPIETSPADFNLTINQLQPDTPTGISGVIVISDNATYWSVWCEGEQVAGNGIYGSADGTIKVSNRKITITNRTKRTQLAIKGYMSSVKVTVNAPTESDDRKLSVDVLNFSPTIGSHQFTTRDCALSVPETLPTTIDKLNDMFKMCYNITTDITGWDTSRVTNMDWMFWLATNFNQDLSVWNVEQIPVEPVNFADGTDAWVLPKPIWGTNAGVRDPELEAPKPEYTPFEFNITASKTVGMRLEVSGVSGPWQIYKDDVLINMGDESFGIQYIENIEAGVTNIQVYAEGGNISIADMNEGSTDSIDFISFCAMIPQHMFRLTNSNFTVPEVLPITQTDTSNMFNGCNLFNQDISGWDTSHVTKMAAMFSECVAFNQPIGNWDVSKVTWFNGMFNGAHIFNHDLSGWDLSSAIYTHEMFYSALAFNQDISSWNVATVTDMHGMFRNAYEFNQDISGWDVSGVTSMDYMFFVAKVFNQDLSSWNVSLIPDLPPYFDTAADAWTKPKPVWGSAGLAAPTV